MLFYMKDFDNIFILIFFLFRLFVFQEARPPLFYFIASLIITVIQCMGLSVHFNQWPLGGSIFHAVDEFFGFDFLFLSERE